MEYLEFFDFLHYVTDERNVRAPKRYLRDAENPLELFDDDQFFNKYRFSKAIFLPEVFPLLKEDMETTTHRGQPLPPILKVLTVLRFYATGNYQIDTGNAHSMSQPTTCQLVKKVSTLLARKLSKFVKFPSLAEMRGVKTHFHAVAGFPGVVGCIDCTHIPIQNPKREDGENFRNRTGNFSINVQVISGPNGEIFDVVARWPGSAHKSRIFNNSSIKTKFEQREIRGLLLGDNGYAQTHYLFTPVLDPQGLSEEKYNNCHIATRCTVDRLFGMWKRRFSCLRRQLANKLTTTTHIISACAVLHNIAVKCKEQLPPEEQEIGPFDNDDQQSPALHYDGDIRRGAVVRKNFINKHFS